MRALDPRLLRHAQVAWAYLAACVAIGTLVALLLLLQANLLAEAIASDSEGGSSAAVFADVALPIALVFAARGLLVWLQEVMAARSSARVKATLRSALLAHALRLGPGWLADERRGQLVTLAGDGLDRLDAYFARYLPQLILAVTVPVVMLLQLAVADPLSAAVVGVTLPLVPMFMALVGRLTGEQTRKRWRAQAVLAHHFTDVVAGLTTLKTFGRAKVQASQVGRSTEMYRRTSLATLRVAFLSSLVLEMAASLSMALVAVGVGLRLVGSHLDLRTALLVLLLAPEAYLPLRQLGANFHASADGLAAAEDVFRILDTPAPSSGKQRVRSLEVATVEVVSVTVVDPSRNHRRLPTTSFSLRPAEFVAISGSSGAGKSTLLTVLLQHTPATSGRVLVDGVDLTAIDPTCWRRQVAWVPQHPILPAATVGANVALGVPGADDETVRAALRRAGADHLEVARQTGSNGALLSAGERRRVAIARALLYDAPLLLLDEPTAGLDEATELQVIASLRASGRTVLAISHRPAVLQAADRVVQVGAVLPIDGAPSGKDNAGRARVEESTLVSAGSA